MPQQEEGAAAQRRVAQQRQQQDGERQPEGDQRQVRRSRLAAAWPAMKFPTIPAAP